MGLKSIKGGMWYFPPILIYVMQSICYFKAIKSPKEIFIINMNTKYGIY